MRHLSWFLCLAPLACGSESTRADGSGGASGADSLSAGSSGIDSVGDDSDGDGTDDAEGGAQTSPADSGDDGGPTVFDVASPDGDSTCGGAMGGGGILSYIWIANSSEGTVSKINTDTMIEEGRYIVRADALGSPSRTSVNLNGDMSIANRMGGVTKIYARPENCQESNGTPGIQTSSGGGDILAWGQEECIAWHTPLVCASNRPMAWTQGEWSEATCRWENTKLWTECWNNTGPQVLLLDGETGVVEQTIPIPNVNAMVYGGAVDGDGHFWGVQSGAQLIRVDFNDFTVQTWPTPVNGPSYGIAVDGKGRPWLCGGGGASRFDMATGLYDTTVGAGISIGGCMSDANGILWHARYPDGVLVGIDTDTVAVVQELAIPAYVHGVSIDFAGNVWGVTFASTQAFRVNPVSGQVDTFNGLVGAYTYSDMTGFALSSAGAPSG